MAASKNHDYHLVEPDPWPIIGAFSALALFGGLVMWWHDNPYGKIVFDHQLYMVNRTDAAPMPNTNFP